MRRFGERRASRVCWSSRASEWYIPAAEHEGRLFTITRNSDNHRTILDTARNGDFAPGQSFDSTGRLPAPVESSTPLR